MKKIYFKKSAFTLLVVFCSLLLSSVDLQAQVIWDNVATTGRTNNEGTNTSPTVNKPSSIVSGDLVLIFLHMKDKPASVTLPSGFTQIAVAAGATDGDDAATYAFYKIAGGAEPTTYDFTVAAAPSNVPNWRINAVRVTGHSPTNPIGAATTAYSSTAVTILALSSISTTTDKSRFVASISTFAAGTSITMSSMTNSYNTTGTGTYAGRATRQTNLATAGATGTRTFTWSNAQPAAGLMFVINAIDTDSDGITDADDLDKDNDGIIDEREKAYVDLGTSATTFDPLLQQWQTSSVSVTAGTNYVITPTNFSLGYATVSGGPLNGQSVAKAAIYSGDLRWSDLEGREYQPVTNAYSGTSVAVDLPFANVLSGQGNYGNRLLYLGMVDVNGNGQYDNGTDEFIGTVFTTSGLNNRVFTPTVSGTIYLVYADNFYGDNAGSLSFRVQRVEDRDTDLDGVLDELDTDSDNDGIPDALEANHSLTAANLDANGRITGGVGTNGVPTLAGAGYTPANTDGADVEDFIDIDSDNDGIVDVIESQPTVGYKAPTGLDHDNDGIDNAFDVNFNVANTLVTTLEDTDGDTTPDIYDADSDGDGATDMAEAGQGTYAAADTDGDGLANVFDDVVKSISPTTNSTNGGQTATSPFTDTFPGGEADWRNKICVKPGETVGGTLLGTDVIISIMDNSVSGYVSRNNAYLILEAKTKGFVITRMTTANLPSGANAVKGMLVYDTDVNCLKMYNGTTWGCLTPDCVD